MDEPEEIQVETPEQTEQEEEDRIAELVEFIAKTLSNYPDAVKVRSEEEGSRTIITLEVDDRDKGKVIGRQGRVAQALRSLLRVAAVKQNNPHKPGNRIRQAASGWSRYSHNQRARWSSTALKAPARVFSPRRRATDVIDAPVRRCTIVTFGLSRRLHTRGR